MIEIRPFDIKELDTILELYVNNFKDLTADNIEYKKNKFKKDIMRFTKANIPGEILVAVENNKIIGFASFIKKGHWYFGPFTVIPEYRGKNIGKLLLKSSLEIIKKEGGGKIRLTVQKNNQTAIKIYENHNFKITSFIMELDI
ncbi:MAG: GNAT family N-acetyltransferase [Candidatus Lokiarchaeota archaeon]|nr:GNAT family N-acetyltransferase [Candidatus Lokiarchaeota archaeon]